MNVHGHEATLKQLEHTPGACRALLGRGVLQNLNVIGLTDDVHFVSGINGWNINLADHRAYVIVNCLLSASSRGGCADCGCALADAWVSRKSFTFVSNFWQRDVSSFALCLAAVTIARKAVFVAVVLFFAIFIPRIKCVTNIGDI